MSGASGHTPPRPTPEVARRVEELLREQLREAGIDPAALEPADIAANMTCTLAPDNSMTYAWKGAPLLHVRPEIKHGPDGESVLWRMFTRDDAPEAGAETSKRPVNRDGTSPFHGHPL